MLLCSFCHFSMPWRNYSLDTTAKLRSKLHGMKTVQCRKVLTSPLSNSMANEDPLFRFFVVPVSNSASSASDSSSISGSTSSSGELHGQCITTTKVFATSLPLRIVNPSSSDITSYKLFKNSSKRQMRQRKTIGDKDGSPFIACLSDTPTKGWQNSVCANLNRQLHAYAAH